MFVASFVFVLPFFKDNALHISAPTRVAMPLDIKVGKITSDGLCEFAAARIAMTVAGIS